jgi:ribonuclease Z
MSTTVTLTGTGVPHPAPGRAGAGALVRYGDVALQFDAGRGTVIRLAEADCLPVVLSALFVTHYHSDHVVDLADVTMTRWIQQQVMQTGPLRIVTPQGCALEYVQHMLDPYHDDIEVRMEHVGAGFPGLEIIDFAAPAEPVEVWRSDDGAVRVSAVAVHHEPVRDAVAYRVDTPDGAVVISGDTRACREVFELARGADVVVHEACRATALAERVKGTVFETIFSYHADTVALGALAEEHAVPHMLLTHMIPAPKDEADEERFVADLRRGGYTGPVTAGRDLDVFEINAGSSTLTRRR